jgi:hypothetical protein
MQDNKIKTVSCTGLCTAAIPLAFRALYISSYTTTLKELGHDIRVAGKNQAN